MRPTNNKGNYVKGKEGWDMLSNGVMKFGKKEELIPKNKLAALSTTDIILPVPRFEIITESERRYANPL